MPQKGDCHGSTRPPPVSCRFRRGSDCRSFRQGRGQRARDVVHRRRAGTGAEPGPELRPLAQRSGHARLRRERPALGAVRQAHERHPEVRAEAGSGPAPRPRGQIGGRPGGRHAGPLARPGHHLGLPGGQARLRREADLAQHLRRPADGRGGAEVQPRRAGRHPVPQRPLLPRSDRLRSLGQAGHGPHGQGLEQPASPARAAGRGQSRARRPRLGHLARPRRREALQHQPLHLRLALDVGLRDRRHG